MPNETGEITPRALFRYRLAGLLAGLGLVVQALTLLEEHPVTFILFLLGGGGLVVAGLVTFVWAWISELTARGAARRMG